MSKPTRTRPFTLAAISKVRVLGAVIAVSCVGWLPATVSAQQAGVKIGFVSTERIMKDANPAKAAQAKIEQDFSRRDKELQDLNARLRSASEKLDKDASVLAESDRTRRQREFREDLNQRRNEELAAVLEKANRAIKEIAEREKFDLILQEAVFVSPRMDITDQVVKQLNAGK